MSPATMSPPDHTARSLRSCLGRFATGVAVVSFAAEGETEPRGLTVNSFTSVSMEPPLVLVSVARRARSHDALRGRPFCVNVLGAEQEPLARRFAGGARGEQTAEDEPTWLRDRVAPRLAGALALLACEPWRDYDGGDHTLFLGRVVDYDFRDGDALGYHASRYTPIADEQLGIEDLL